MGKKWEYTETVHQLSIDSKKPHNSVRNEVSLLYNVIIVIIEFGISMKPVRWIKMCPVVKSA
jgi:hypothetical protein